MPDEVGVATHRSPGAVLDEIGGDRHGTSTELRAQAEARFGGERSRDAVHVEGQSVDEDEGIELVRVSAHALRIGQRARRFRTSGPRRAEARGPRLAN
jgi:hypothetical protein